MVLHNSLSNQVSIINNTQLPFGSATSFTLPRRRSFAGERNCPTCGHRLGSRHKNSQFEGAPGKSSTGAYQNSNISKDSFERDVNYFKLLGDISRESQTAPQIESSGISSDAFSQGYFKRFFVTKHTLGRGSNGVVYLVEHLLENVSLGLFALKKVAVGDNKAWLQKTLGEVNLLRMLSHPNLVGYNHVWLEISSLSQFGPSIPCAFILQEYCNGGTLEDYVRKTGLWTIHEPNETKRERLLRQSGLPDPSRSTNSKRLSNFEIISFMIDIVRGVAHLHSHHIIHRDLKPSNCLLIIKEQSSGTSSTELPSVLVGDFGEGQMEGILRSETGSTGTLEYCAPELINRVQGRLGQFTQKSDVFSLGMILYFLCHGRLPYENSALDEEQDLELLTQEIKDFQGLRLNLKGIRKDVDVRLYQAMSKMLEVDPEERPTTDEVLSLLEELGNGIYPQVTRKMTHPVQVAGLLSNGETTSRPKRELRLPSLPQWSNYIAVKALLLAVKVAILAKMPPNVITQTLLLLLGLEIPM